MGLLEFSNVDFWFAVGIGIVIGAIITFYILRPENNKNGNSAFLLKDMQKWRLPPEWATILSDNGSREKAIEELEKIDNKLKVRETEYNNVKKRISAISTEFQSEVEKMEKEKTPAVRLLMGQANLAMLTAQITQVRKKSEAHINAVLPLEWQKEFMGYVRDEIGKAEMKRILYREDIIRQIEDNATRQHEYLHAELDGLTGGDESGTKALYSKLFGISFEE
jgi:hypothetical protein